MEIRYTTKEESNKNQREEFMKLSPEDRFFSFLELMIHIKKFPNSKLVKKNKNFTIIIKDD